jgi:hypothetical protein
MQQRNKNEIQNYLKHQIDSIDRKKNPFAKIVFILLVFIRIRRVDKQDDIYRAEYQISYLSQ